MGCPLLFLHTPPSLPLGVGGTPPQISSKSRTSPDGGLLSDAVMLAQGRLVRTIGMTGIKRRRVDELQVDCHPGTKVGDYVPFCFCPRSVMLYVIHRANHPELSYRDGQGPIVHLEADLQTVIRWAEESSVRWAFSLSNAGAYYTEFRSRVEDLHEWVQAWVGSTGRRSVHASSARWPLFRTCGLSSSNAEVRHRRSRARSLEGSPE